MREGRGSSTVSIELGARVGDGGLATAIVEVVVVVVGWLLNVPATS